MSSLKLNFGDSISWLSAILMRERSTSTEYIIRTATRLQALNMQLFELGHLFPKAAPRDDLMDLLCHLSTMSHRASKISVADELQVAVKDILVLGDILITQPSNFDKETSAKVAVPHSDMAGEEGWCST